MTFEKQWIDGLGLEGRIEAESGPEDRSGAAIKLRRIGRAHIQFAQVLAAEFDGEERRPGWADHGGVRDAGGIEGGGEGAKLFEASVVSFEIVSVQDDCEIGELVLVARDAAGTGLAQFGEQHFVGAQSGFDTRVELASAEEFAGIVGGGHGASASDLRRRTSLHQTGWDVIGQLAGTFNLFKTVGCRVSTIRDESCA